jgi:ParB family chromosome partitioning protein
VKNISSIGLKKPITVSRRAESKDNGQYDLVCGQGRLEALADLGETMIPAIVIDVPKEERLLRSLVENLARRTPTTMELVRQIELLRERNYSSKQIAQKIAVHRSYVAGILRLLKNGEKGLLQAVDKGRISVHIAVQIAASDDTEVQQALTEAYEKKQLTGKALMQARKIIEQRKSRGKSFVGRGQRTSTNQSSSQSMVRAYNQEADRQRVLIRKAKACETFHIFLVGAFRQLFQDKEFIALLQSESLDTLPKSLADRIQS